MPALARASAPRPHVLALRETFQIARGAADEETVVAAEFERDGIVARGEGAPVDYWGETPEGIVAALEADGAALLGDDLFAGEAILARVARLGRPAGRQDGARRRRSTTGSAGASASRSGGCSAPTGSRRRPRTRSASTRVEGTADRTRRATGYEVLKIKVGGPGDLERLRAVRAETGGAAADRRQRGLGPRDRARR